MQRKYHIEKSAWDDKNYNRFQFQRKTIEEIDIVNLGNDLKNYTDIELRLDSCTFGGNAFYHMCNLINDNKNITVLWIDETISHNDFEILADKLKGNSNIKILFLENVHVGDSGAITLSKALQ